MDNLVNWAYEISRSKLADALPRRWRHVQAVATQATKIAPAFAPESELLIAAAVLHDVGYAPDLAETGFHPLDGARYLLREGAPERLCALVAHHSGAAIEAEIRGIKNDLAKFNDEGSSVRDALWYCDMTSGPDGQRFSFKERVQEIRLRYGAGTITYEFLNQAEDELANAVDRTESILAAHRPT